MEVILLEQVGNVGKLGDIINVKNGYARNYLIPQGKAKRATKANLEEFEAKKAEYEAKQAQILKEAQEKQAALNDKEIVIEQKAGVDGRLFGSVTTMDVVDAVKKIDIEIHRSNVRLPNGPLKTTGDYDLEIALHHDAVAVIHVKVVPLEEHPTNA